MDALIEQYRDILEDYYETYSEQLLEQIFRVFGEKI